MKRKNRVSARSIEQPFPNNPCNNTRRFDEHRYCREGPSRTHKVLNLIYKDEVVELLGVSPDGAWKNLRTVEGFIGWSSAKYLLNQGGEPLPDPEPATGQYRVTAHALYLREGPGRSYKALGYLKRDDVVSAIGASADRKWKQIRHANGLAGWCSGKYLFSLDDVEPPLEPDPDAIQYQVTAHALHVREGAGSSYKAITHLQEGDVVTGVNISADGKWRQIRLNSGEIGWASSKYLAVFEEPEEPVEIVEPLITAGPLNSDQQAQLHTVSLRYLAPTVEDCIRVGEEFNGTGYGHPSNICGPLAIAILQSAYLVSAQINPHDFWLLNPDVNQSTLRDAFPEERFNHFKTKVSINQFDWVSVPLLPGDFLYLYSGSRGNFEHMLVVTRTDLDQRAYATTNHKTENGFIISEELLYDPNKAGKGLFYRWTEKPKALLGSTGFGGFQLWRLKEKQE
ncbi:MAG: hypothetical protein B6I38_09765 [Anaerolineaceae bacterium 4572_5.1]|nr:MAG: hypothetical protein B6I38_09765 [Anaerolineaceae bacterium 4572_5.1]